MALRRIDMLAGDLTLDTIKSALGDHETTDLFLIRREDDRLCASIVIEESLTESVTDALENAFCEQDGFQLLVYDIAARLPRPSEEDTPKQNDNTSKRERISREELRDDLEPGSRVTRIYLAQVVISCIVAAIGMIRDSVALVIAAMVIAPLLLPSMSLALGTTIGDLRMIFRSVLASAAGIATGLVLSVLIGLTVPFDGQVDQLATRSAVSYTDIVVAFAAGAAGALSVTTGVSAALVGVMVAVALVPPLVAAGLFFGAGDYAAAGMAATLLATNVVCVNLAAVGVFLLQGILPSQSSDQDRARLAVRHALVVWVVLLIALFILITYASPENPLTDGH